MQTVFHSLAVQHDSVMRAATYVARRRTDAGCVDRARLVGSEASRTVIVIDGEASHPESGRAADVALAGILASPLLDPDSLVGAILTADHDIAAAGLDAQVSGVVFTVQDGCVSGASAGDCEAWFVPDDGSKPIELSADQYRRPRIGDTPVPVPFRKVGLPRGLIVSGSDGLWVNAVRSEVFEIARRAPTHRVPEMLAYYVFARKGGVLPDDIAVAAIEL